MPLQQANPVLMHSRPLKNINNWKLTQSSTRISTQSQWRREIVLERRQGSKPSGINEVNQRPQLSEIILHWRSGENDSMPTPEAFANLCDLCIWVSNLMAFVKNGVGPV